MMHDTQTGGSFNLTQSWAKAFAEDWVAAWNAHDLGRILAHYTDDFEMTSPYIVKFSGEASGTLTGKANVGAYWQLALERIPDLHFELIDVFVAVSSVAIYYRGALGKIVVEVLYLNEHGQAYKAVAHYDSLD